MDLCPGSAPCAVAGCRRMVGAALDENHFGAHIGQHHAGKGGRAYACKFEDAHSGQRAWFWPGTGFLCSSRSPVVVSDFSILWIRRF
jgi:hypothetical protein